MSVINHYRAMWVIVFFDLPTETAEARKKYARFRKKLLKDGFTMMQFSVYIRHCASRENADVHARKIQYALPSEGIVSILSITDKQFGEIKNFWGKKRKRPPPPPTQLEMF